MRSFTSAFYAILFSIFLTAPVLAQSAYSTSETDIGTLLDDPAAAEIVEKHIPGFTTNPQTMMARSFTLPALQSFVPDAVSDEVLEKIDADLATLQ